MDGAIQIARVFGIDIRVHISWFFIFLLVTWSVAVGYLPFALPGASSITYWLLGAAAAVLLFVSVLIHELSHSLVARSRGMGVHSITLFLFGGVSTIKGESATAGDEFKIAFVGPLTSVALAVVFFALAFFFNFGRAADAVLNYLWTINLGLAVFNLIPGYPLDGGRVFRAIVWQITNDRIRATQIAATVGTIIAYLFILGGLLLAFTGNVIGGLWIAFIGWFLSNAASQSRMQLRQEAQFAGVEVRDVMRPNPIVVSPDFPLVDAIYRYILPGTVAALPVVDGRGLSGILTLTDLRTVPQDRWPELRVGQVMGGRNGVQTVAPNTPLTVALERLAEGDFNQMPVVQYGQVVGMLSRSDIVRYLQVRQALNLRGEQRGTPSAA